MNSSELNAGVVDYSIDVQNVYFTNTCDEKTERKKKQFTHKKIIPYIKVALIH